MTIPPLTFINARVLRSDGFSTAPLSVADGVISSRGGREIDLSGHMILPGIIDLHGDGFERHVAPRRGAVTDPQEGIATLDAELAANGITTAVLAQFFSWEGGMRGPDFAERLIQALAAARTLTEMRVQLRLEINLLADYPRALDLIRSGGIGYVVFNDHLPHAALAAGKRPPRLTGQALKSGRSPEAHLALLQRLHQARGEVPGTLATLATTLQAEGVTLGSHDDRSPDMRRRFRAMGARIAEFPETADTVAAAHLAGDAVIMGAPNVVRGGSHDKKVSAQEVIEAGLCDALVSDYHYPTLRQAALALVDRDVMTLDAAWALISSRPAEVMGWHDRGRLDTGLRGDFVIVNQMTRKPVATFCRGQLAWMAGAVAARFL